MTIIRIVPLQLWDDTTNSLQTDSHSINRCDAMASKSRFPFSGPPRRSFRSVFYSPTGQQSFIVRTVSFAYSVRIWTMRDKEITNQREWSKRGDSFGWPGIRFRSVGTCPSIPFWIIHYFDFGEPLVPHPPMSSEIKFIHHRTYLGFLGMGYSIFWLLSLCLFIAIQSGCWHNVARIYLAIITAFPRFLNIVFEVDGRPASSTFWQLPLGGVLVGSFADAPISNTFFGR